VGLVMDDAFKLLEELVAAPVGEGLPRTRAEALALGVKRYFTGEPCKRGHVDFRLVSTRGCNECMRLYKSTQEGKEYMRMYKSTAEFKERRRMYEEAPKNKERKRMYGATPERRAYDRLRKSTPEYREYIRGRSSNPNYKEYNRQFALAKTGDSVLFSINQAEISASHGKAYADIVPQCPEPQRSKLQALVDQIKADPSAGKQVIGLLRNMRELRKLELAEQQQVTETETEN
jgi:hypothetical protein